MGGTYIENYEKNLVKNTINGIALKMKELGADSEFIYKCTGLKL